MLLKSIKDIVADHRQRVNDRAQFEAVWQDIFDNVAKDMVQDLCKKLKQ